MQEREADQRQKDMRALLAIPGGGLPYGEPLAPNADEARAIQQESGAQPQDRGALGGLEQGGIAGPGAP
jgi:ADP-ribose pyrophosphatase YjhB (NUDIX family)